MLDLLDTPHALQIRVLDDHLIDKGLMNRDVNVFVNCGRDQEATILAVIGWQIRAASAKRKSERAPGDNHDFEMREIRSPVAMVVSKRTLSIKGKQILPLHATGIWRRV